VADVQLEHGHVRIANRLYEAMLDADFSPAQFKILHGLIRLSFGWGKRTVTLSHAELASVIGMNASGSFRAALRELVQNGVVNLVDAGGGNAKATYALQKDFTKWGRWATHPDRLQVRYGARPESHDEFLSARRKADVVDDDTTVDGDEPAQEPVVPLPEPVTPDPAQEQAPSADEVSPPPAQKQADPPPRSSHPPRPEVGRGTGSKSLFDETVGPRKDIESNRKTRTTTATAASSARPTEPEAPDEHTEIRDYAVGLSTAANAGITARWGEQPSPLHYATGLQLAEELRLANIPIEIARHAVASVCAVSKNERPPYTLSYFKGAILDAHRDAEQKAYNAADPGVTRKRGGPPTSIANVVAPAKAQAKRAEEIAYDTARRAAAAEWGRANQTEYQTIRRSIAETFQGFGTATWIDKAVENQVVVECAQLAGFPEFDAWLATNNPPPTSANANEPPESAPNPRVMLSSD
jgi:phage replication O-like protein O